MRESLDKWFICFTKPKAEHKAKVKIEEQGTSATYQSWSLKTNAVTKKKSRYLAVIFFLNRTH